MCASLADSGSDRRGGEFRNPGALKLQYDKLEKVKMTTAEKGPTGGP